MATVRGSFRQISGGYIAQFFDADYEVCSFFKESHTDLMKTLEALDVEIVSWADWEKLKGQQNDEG